MQALKKKVHTLAILTVFLALTLINQAYAYNLKFATDTRFRLSTQDTYICYSGILYANSAKLYNDKVVFGNVYMGSGSTLSSLTLTVSNANLTIKKLYVGLWAEFDLAGTVDSTSTLSMKQVDEPTTVYFNGVTNTTGWTYDSATENLTLTPMHTQALVTVKLYQGSSQETPSGSQGGRYVPPWTPPTTPAITPIVQPPSVGWMPHAIVVTFAVAVYALTERKTKPTRSQVRRKIAGGF